MKFSRGLFWPLVVILLLGVAVRLYDLEAQSLWFDEAWSAYAAAQPTLVAAANADATNPPLYYVLLHLAARGFGDSEFSLRFFSLLMGVLVIALSFRLGRQLYTPRAGLYAALLAALSPLLWWASQEARMYSLLAVLVLVAAAAWHRLVNRGSTWAWISLWSAELALLYAHNTGPVAALWLNGAAALAWLFHGKRRPDWRLWLLGQALVGLLWLPYLASRYLQLSEANSAVSSPPLLNPALIGSVWEAFWAGNWAMVGAEPVLAVLAGVALILTLALVPWRRAATWWLLVHVVLLTGGLIAGLMILGNALHGRYLVLVVPLVLVPVGAGIARLKHALLRWSAASVFGAIFVVAVVYGQEPTYQHDDARAMAAYYAEALGPDDTVLAWSYADRYELAYYWPRLGVQARRVTLPEGADLETVLPLLPAEGDIALNVWYTQRADFRGMMNCLLSHGTDRPPQYFATYGMANLLFRDPVLQPPELRAAAGDFQVGEVIASGRFPATTADTALCLPIRMRLLKSTPHGLKAGVIVKNALGWEIARADAPFALPDQRLSSQLAPGHELTAYPLLRLPYGAPPANYPVYLRVYEEANMTGYEVMDEHAGRGRELYLGTWTVLPGADWAEVGPPTGDDVDGLPVGDDLALLSIDVEPSDRPVLSGETLRLSLLWEGNGTLPDLILTDAEGRWELLLAAAQPLHDSIALDWREARVPASADSGPVHLRLPDGTPLATIQVQGIPFTFEEPEMDRRVDAVFPGVGVLVGYRVEAISVRPGEPLVVELVWQAGDEAPAETSYVVFVHLLSADGELIAQSDSIPAQGGRTTTGWRPGEYIVDHHALEFNDRATAGVSRLIVGLYDPHTGERVTRPGGENAVTLPAEIRVEE